MSHQKLKAAIKPLAAAIAAAATLAALTGCGLAPGSVPTSIPGTAIQGSIHGGQQAVSGSTVQLYAVGASGYGSAATPLLTSTVLSAADGSFSISSKYTCPSASTPVYITATGGNSGFTTNANIAMMAGLGACGNLNSSTFVFINELTTVATVWALSPFMTGPANIGSSASNTLGLANAFDDINTLANIATGTVPGLGAPAGSTIPSSELNTLGDILAACINSAGGVAGDGSSCGKLFTATTAGSAPTDTITAAVNIAQHPSTNISALFALVAAGAPFQPALSSQPNDFTVAVNFFGYFSVPSGLAADSAGNVWVANSATNTASKLNHNGAIITTVAAGTAPSAIAVDSSNFVWITDKSINSITRLNTTGSPVPGSPYTLGGLNQPVSISFDSQGNAWVANSGNASVSAFTSSGTPISGSSGFTGSGITVPAGIAANPH